jgi:hypothetical protein
MPSNKSAAPLSLARHDGHAIAPIDAGEAAPAAAGHSSSNMDFAIAFRRRGA